MWACTSIKSYSSMEPNAGHSQQNVVFNTQLLHVYPVDETGSIF